MEFSVARDRSSARIAECKCRGSPEQHEWLQQPSRELPQERHCAARVQSIGDAAQQVAPNGRLYSLTLARPVLLPPAHPRLRRGSVPAPANNSYLLKALSRFVLEFFAVLSADRVLIPRGRYIWYDPRRDAFHMIFHAMHPHKVPSTAWSKDGLEWCASAVQYRHRFIERCRRLTDTLTHYCSTL